MYVIFNSDILVSEIRKGTLRAYFRGIFKSKKLIIIDYKLFPELEKELDIDENIEFQNLYNEGVQLGFIIESLDVCSLKPFFIELYHTLPFLEKNLNLSTNDRFLITLHIQLGGELKTNDKHIHRAINWLKLEPSKWKEYALKNHDE